MKLSLEIIIVMDINVPKNDCLQHVQAFSVLGEKKKFFFSNLKV